jgi:hypothetical protein
VEGSTAPSAFHLHAWETISENWEVDAKATFAWLCNALILPKKPGGRLIVVSSIAATNGSALSQGRARPKRVQWMLARVRF